MIMSLSPQEIQELTAGYVLGDLTSAEAELFKTLMTKLPELQAEVVALQEALAMMPYGLEEEGPEVGLRSQILTAAESELSQAFPLPPLSKKRIPFRLPWAMSTLVAGLTLVCGIFTVQLSSQVRSLQAQHPQPVGPGELTQAWSGLGQLLQDHQQSLENPQGPVDFVVSQPADIPSRLRGFQTTQTALPLLPQGKLLGGSNCHLGETQGLRLTYKLQSDQTVSAYQLDVTGEPWPAFQSAQLTLQQPDGTGVVLWRDDDYLYALVAELPTAELQALAHAMEDI